MIDLKQAELKEWQDKNFPRSRYESMTKDQLIDMILIMQMALGVAEEAGELVHHVLKGSQGIREGVNGFDDIEIADAVADGLVFGMQTLSMLNVDAEKEVSAVVNKVLERDWLNNPEDGTYLTTGTIISTDFSNIENKISIVNREIPVDFVNKAIMPLGPKDPNKYCSCNKGIFNIYQLVNDDNWYCYVCEKQIDPRSKDIEPLIYCGCKGALEIYESADGHFRCRKCVKKIRKNA